MTHIARSTIFFSGENDILKISENHILLRSRRISSISIPSYNIPEYYSTPIISSEKQFGMFFNLN